MKAIMDFFSYNYVNSEKIVFWLSPLLMIYLYIMRFKSMSIFEKGNNIDNKKRETEETIEKFSGKEIETPEGKEKAKSYIKRGLSSAFEKGAFGSVGLISFFLWLIQKGKEKAREYAISELKKSRGEFKSVVY